MSDHLHSHVDTTGEQHLYVRRDAQPTLEGAAYSAWHRLKTLRAIWWALSVGSEAKFWARHFSRPNTRRIK